MMLAINEVTKKFGSFTALENISLSLTNGLYGLLAPNGAGKTTLIKMLTTLLFPTKGEILWDGASIADLHEKYRQILGYLPQQFGYYKNQTPRQYLHYLAALKGLDAQYAKQRTVQLLDMVTLSDVMDKKMRKFSGGMIQRVGIAQAMLNDPKLLILDEPTAGLDPKERVRFRNLISSLSRDRIIILSTHIVSDIETIAHKVIMLKDRKLLCHETPENISRSLSGKIYETWEIHQVKQPHFILTERQEGSRTLVRFICEQPQYEGPGVAVEPGLEDVFLYAYRDENEQ